MLQYFQVLVLIIVGLVLLQLSEQIELGIFLSLIPLFSTILAMIFFNEKFLFFHFIGSVLIILGLFLSNKKITNA